MTSLTLDRGLQFEIAHEDLALADQALAHLRAAHGLTFNDADEPPRRLACVLDALSARHPELAYYAARLARCRAAPCVAPLLLKNRV